MKTVPGGATLDDQGRPTDANGNRLDPLPEQLTDEQRQECREAGIIAQKQVDYWPDDALIDRFGLPPETVKALTKPDLFASDADQQVEATHAAEELAEEEGIDLSEVEGTGKDGKVTKPDVEAALTPDSE
jgi:pyruvate/2-oxoglutarate dehydrogenase complex dihydrolipoamide acyltransferase (E2) component